MAKLDETEKIALVLGAGLLFFLGLPALVSAAGKKGARKAKKRTRIDVLVMDSAIFAASQGKELVVAGTAATACAALKEIQVPLNTEIEIDATRGTQAAVDELMLCLSDLGYSNVISFTE